MTNSEPSLDEQVSTIQRRLRLQRRLRRLRDKTSTAAGLPAEYWGDGNASERQIKDDHHAGRIAWRAAWMDAKRGLELLAEKDLEGAALFAWTATDFYVEALEAQLQVERRKPAGMSLSSPAKRRGRPRKDSPTLK